LVLTAVFFLEQALTFFLVEDVFLDAVLLGAAFFVGIIFSFLQGF
jgi:hypothetical protein